MLFFMGLIILYTQPDVTNVTPVHQSTSQHPECSISLSKYIINVAQRLYSTIDKYSIVADRTDTQHIAQQEMNQQ